MVRWVYHHREYAVTVISRFIEYLLSCHFQMFTEPNANEWRLYSDPHEK